MATRTSDYATCPDRASWGFTSGEHDTFLFSLPEEREKMLDSLSALARPPELLTPQKDEQVKGGLFQQSFNQSPPNTDKFKSRAEERGLHFIDWSTNSFAYLAGRIENVEAVCFPFQSDIFDVRVFQSWVVLPQKSLTQIAHCQSCRDRMSKTSQPTDKDVMIETKSTVRTLQKSLVVLPCRSLTRLSNSSSAKHHHPHVNLSLACCRRSRRTPSQRSFPCSHLSRKRMTA